MCNWFRHPLKYLPFDYQKVIWFLSTTLAETENDFDLCQMYLMSGHLDKLERRQPTLSHAFRSTGDLS